MKKTAYLLVLASAMLTSCKQAQLDAKNAPQSFQSIDQNALDLTISPADDFFLFANGT